MPFLSPGLTRVLTQVAASAQPDLCVITRKTSVSDGMGGMTDSWAAIAAGVPCRVMNTIRQGVEAAEEGRIEDRLDWRIALPVGQDVTARDRIAADGMNFEVLGVLAPMSYEVERVVQCVVLQ